MNKNTLDPFERRLKDSLEEFEVPYNSADWAQLQRAMAGSSGRARWSKGGLLALLLAGGMAAGGVYWSFSDEVVADTVQRPSGAVATEAAPRIIDTPAGQAGSEVPPAQVDQAITVESAGPTTGPRASTSTSAPIERTSLSSTAVAAVAEVVAPSSPTAKDDGTMAFSASVAEGCPGTAIQFTANGTPDDAIYLWNFGDGSFSNQARPDHTFAKSGKFEVMLSVSNPGGGTILSKPSSDLIVIHEAPEASFNAQKVEYDGHIPSVHFENRSIGGKQYSWDFGDGSTSSVAHPDHIFLKKGVYSVKLTVTNESGCVDTREREIRIERDYNLDAPLSFSPNSDGNDDLFMPEALRTLGVRFNLVIQDAGTGRKVYETTDATRPWTGRVDNRSEVCAAGEYVWMATIKEGAHLGDVVFNGKVSLVR
ncbi:MAG: PKD domain-containing protein [Flavobacteriales bacterium]|nr:PKD domain-containing protein [Flavobacteriales bacterium]MBK8949923.1 PKD domain-containing protein [Flavobacteriales bacterium]MBK9700628.1 PKD domain-containing protein [Flavobacteriales bacterium]